ncbi:MAG: RHS repeat-associated core domain-containing protein [Chloroflexota bacterium]
MSLARRLGPLLLAAVVAATSLGLDAAHPAGAVVRSYVVDDGGSVVKLVIPGGEPGAGTYLPTWNGHGDALALWRLADDGTGTLSLANSYTYGTWGTPTTAVHNGIADLGFRFLYVGEFDVQWDNAFGLGLLYMHARTYSPALGRFLQPDPDRSEANLYAYAANNPITELDPDGTCFILCAVINAVLDTAIYLATTDSSEWSVGGIASTAVTGAVTGFVGAGILSKVAKIGAVANLASKASRAVSRAIKPNVVARAHSGILHGNSLANDRVATLYKAYSRTTGEFQKWGITSNLKKRYASTSDLFLVPKRTGSRQAMAALERRVVSRFGGPLNREPWSSSR